ncbi:hypothetical protein Pmar_PMAR008490, partial [Perkinsus marinus ATCC 50983]
SIDTNIWDERALQCLQRASDTLLDPLISNVTTFQLITLCDCLSKMTQRGLE